MDVLASTVEGLRRLPFRSVSVVGMVAQPDAWSTRFNKRFPTGHPNRRERLDEASLSLGWMLNQPDETIHWVEHVTDRPEIAASKIINIATEDLSSHADWADFAVGQARSRAHQMLARMDDMSR